MKIKFLQNCIDEVIKPRALKIKKEKKKKKKVKKSGVGSVEWGKLANYGKVSRLVVNLRACGVDTVHVTSTLSLSGYLV